MALSKMDFIQESAMKNLAVMFSNNEKDINPEAAVSYAEALWDVLAQKGFAGDGDAVE